MWRHGILAASAALALAGCTLFVLAGCGGSGGKSSTAASAPDSTATRGARVVHYTLDGRDEIAVVPRRHSRQLLVFLHGRGAGPQQFLSGQLFSALDQPNAPIVVMLNGGNHSYWHDRKSGKWGSMVVNRAIPDAKRRFHTKGKVAIGGISMGGYGALHLASRHPEQFCAVGGHSAALWMKAGSTAPGAFDNADDYAHNDVFSKVSKLKKVQVWLDAGKDDPFRSADAELARRLSVQLHVYPGGHDSAYWNAHMPLYLAFYQRACA